MRFDCEQCKSKYSIEDARVRGKVLKIRCKNCGNVITVREQPAGGKTETPAAVSGVAGNGSPALSVTPTPASQRAVELRSDGPDRSEGGLDAEEDRTVFSVEPPPGVAPEPEWFISCDGQQEGPFFVENAAQRAREATARGQEVHAWREGFGDWLPIAQVPELARILQAASPAPHAPRSRPPAPAPSRESAAMRGGEDSRPSLRSSAPVAPAAPAKSGPSRVQEEPPLRRSRYTGDEDGATPLPTPAFYSGEFPLDDLMGEGQGQDQPQDQPHASSSSAPRQEGGRMFPTSDPGQELLISDPSVMVPLPIMAELAKTERSAPVEIPPPTAREPAPRRRGGVIVMGGIAAAGALGLIAYLVLGRSAGDPAGERRTSRKIDDAPIALVDNPIVTGGVPRGQVGSGKGAGAARPATADKMPHGGTVSAPPRQGEVSGPKVQRIGALAAPSLGEVAGEGRSLERTPTDLTESQGGKVNPEDMLRVVRQNKKSVELCYERGLKFDSNLKGKVEVELKVGISGRVTDVKLLDPAIAASQLGMCLSQSIKRWNFPPSGSEYNFAFPLILQAN